MSFMVTLIADGALSDASVADAGRRLLRADCGPDAAVWIEPGSAAVIPCQFGLAAAKVALAPLTQAIDIVVGRGQPARLLIADMDSTMITVECIDELADYAGIKPQIAAITERAMRGELDFSAALTERVALLAGLSQDVIAQCLAERVRMMPGARTLVQTMKAHGARCVLVSGGFTHFAEPVAAALGFDVAIANRLDIVDGLMTGRVHQPIVDSSTKLATLHAQCAELGIEPADVLAVGDGANDIPMIAAAGLGVAYHAHPAAMAAADAAIRHGDLTSLLYAQAISRARWVL